MDFDLPDLLDLLPTEPYLKNLVSMESFLNSSLQIQIQPKQNFHFCFERELKNTQGFITGRGAAVTNGRNCSVRDTYPKIQMKLRYQHMPLCKI